MTGSTLNPPEESRPGTGIGHTTGALGPSDSSDSGSDIRGAIRHPGDIEDELDGHALEGGDLELASDTDRAGTGERASADGDGGLELDGDVMPRGAETIEDLAETAGGVDGDGSDASDVLVPSTEKGPHAEFGEEEVHDALAHSSEPPATAAKGVK